MSASSRLSFSSVGKFEVAPESGRFLRANKAMCEFLGYSEEELLARSVYDITYPDNLERDRELCRRLDAGESAVFDVEKRYIRKDGKTVWARTTVNVIHDENNAIGGGREGKRFIGFHNRRAIYDDQVHRLAELGIERA